MKFTLKQLFAIVDGRLCTSISDVYDILGQFTKKSLFTHQLPIAHKQLKEENPEWFQEASSKINELKKVHGNDFEKLMDALDNDNTEIEIP